VLNTAKLFEEGIFQGTVAGVSAEISDLLESKFDRLNRMATVAAGEPRTLFDSTCDLKRQPDFAEAENKSSIDLLESFSDFGFLEASSTNLKFDRRLKSGPDISAKVRATNSPGWMGRREMLAEIPSDRSCETLRCSLQKIDLSIFKIARSTTKV
jgi:hypothetical protein